MRLGGTNLNEGKEVYVDTLSEGFSSKTFGNPIMILSEVIADIERLIAYSLDFEVDPKFLTGGDEFKVVKNPDVINDGDGLIKKIDGGELVDAGVGLTWTILVDDGKVLDPENLDLKIPGPITVLADTFNPPTQDNFPSPFLLFNQKDIS